MPARPGATQFPPPRQRHREITDIARLRSELLCGEDKALMEMIFEKGNSFAEIAKLTGQSPSSINRRFRTLLQKPLTKELLALLGYRQAFDAVDISICRDYFLQSLPRKIIARKLSVSYYRIDRTLKTVQYLFYDGTPPVRNRTRKSTPRCKGANHAHV